MATRRLVGELLKSQTVRTVHPEQSLEMCATVLSSNNISRVPVVDDNGQLVGLLSERDIRVAGSVPYLHPAHLDTDAVTRLKSITADEVMSRNPVSISTGTAVEDVVKLMSVRSIRGLPVVDPTTDKVVAMCTQTDMLNYLVEVLKE